MKPILFVCILAILLLTLSGIVACKDKKTAAPAATGKEQTYTCPMHPQVVRKEPGTCPICGMDLVPFDKNNQDASLTLGKSQQMLANIQTIPIGSGSLERETRLNGRLVADPEGTTYISTRVAGRVDQLFVRQTGEQVAKGQPLYRIYSEQLLALQQEYQVLAAQAAAFPADTRFAQLERAARQKLLLYGQTQAQVQALVRSKKTDPLVTYFAPASGTVSELTATEGQYLPEGGTLMKLESYAGIWVEADVYPAEAARVRVGQKAQVLIAGYEDQPQPMTLSFVTPAVQAGAQLVQVRGSIANPAGRYQPGLQAIILLPAESHGKALTLPVDAVIRDGKTAHVWVQVQEGKFAPRVVQLGAETADQVEIRGGLEEGDQVVISGAYLLYSEYVLKKGKNPAAG